ncbi:MAG: hypothetical protein AAF416_16840 [Pseudomonadota bacterium]
MPRSNSVGAPPGPLPEVQQQRLRASSTPQPALPSLVPSAASAPPRQVRAPINRAPRLTQSAYRAALQNHETSSRQNTIDRVIREDRTTNLRHAVDRMATKKNVGWYAAWRAKADRHWMRDDYRSGEWDGKQIASGGAGSAAKYGLKGAAADRRRPGASHVQRAMLLHVSDGPNGPSDARVAATDRLAAIATRIDPSSPDQKAWRADRTPTRWDAPAAFLLQTRGDMHRLRSAIKDNLIIANLQLDALRAARDTGHIASDAHATYAASLESVISDLSAADDTISTALIACDRLLAGDEVAQLSDPGSARPSEEAAKRRQFLCREIRASFGVAIPDAGDDADAAAVDGAKVDLGAMADRLGRSSAQLRQLVSDGQEPAEVRGVINGMRAANAAAASADSADYAHGVKRHVLSGLQRAERADRGRKAGSITPQPEIALFAEADAFGMAGHYENRCRELLGLHTIALRDRLARGALHNTDLQDTKCGDRSLGEHLDGMTLTAKKIALRRMREDIDRQTADLKDEEEFLRYDLRVAQQRNAAMRKQDPGAKDPNITEMSRRLGMIERERIDLRSAEAALRTNAAHEQIDLAKLPPLKELTDAFQQDLKAVQDTISPRLNVQLDRSRRQKRNADAIASELETLHAIATGLHVEVASVRRDEDLDAMSRSPQFTARSGRTLRASRAEAKTLRQDLEAEVKAGNWERKIGRKWHQVAAAGLKKVFTLSFTNKTTPGTKSLFKSNAQSTGSIILAKNGMAANIVEAMGEARESVEDLADGTGEGDDDKPSPLPPVPPADHGAWEPPDVESLASAEHDIEGFEKASNIEAKAAEDVHAKEIAVDASVGIEAFAGFVTSGLKLRGHLTDIKRKKAGIELGEDLLARRERRLAGISDDRQRSEVRNSERIAQFAAERLTDQSFGSDIIKTGISALSMARYADKAIKPAYSAALASAGAAGAANPLLGAATNAVDMVFAAHDAKKAFISTKAIKEAATAHRESFTAFMEQNGVDLKNCYHFWSGKPNWQKIENRIEKAGLDEKTAKQVRAEVRSLAQTEMLVELSEDGKKLKRKLCLFGAKAVTTGAYSTTGGLIVAGAAGGITILGPVGGGLAAGVALTFFTGVQIAKNGEKYRAAVGREALAGASNPARLAMLQKEAVKRGVAGDLEETALHLATLQDPTLKAAEIVSRIKHAALTTPRAGTPEHNLLPTEAEKQRRAEYEAEIDKRTDEKNALNAEWRALMYPAEREAWQATNPRKEPRSERVLEAAMTDAQNALHDAVANLKALNGELAGRIAASTKDGQLLYASGQVPAEVLLAVAEAPASLDTASAELLADMMY